MTAQLRFQHGLATLQITLDRVGGHDDQVVFRLARGTQELVEVARCRASAVGALDLLTHDRGDDETTSVPADVVERLQQATGEKGWPTGPFGLAILWLEFPEPRGVLHTLPWERLLAPIGRRIIRPPISNIRPLQSRRTRDIGICVGTLDDTRAVTVETLFHILTYYMVMLGSSSMTGTVHLFTDAASADLARTAVFRTREWVMNSPTWRRALSFEHVDIVREPPPVVIHSPGRDMPEAGVEDQSVVANPWLVWMRDELRGKSLDWAHFFCGGDISNQHGAMRLSAGPTDRGDQPLIDVAELNAFMTQIGAWALTLTGLGDDRSLALLRELVDAIAFERPGVFIVHDLQRDPLSQQWISTGNGPDPAITRWVYPPGFGTYDTPFLAGDSTSTFFPDSGRRAIQEGGADRWLVAAARVMEILHMQWLPSDGLKEADPAAVQVLRNVGSIVDRYASEYARYSGGESV